MTHAIKPQRLDVGYALSPAPILDEHGAPRDLSSATVVEVLVRRPSGVETTLEGVLLTGGADGRVARVTEPGDLDEAGVWTIQAHVVLEGGGEFHGPLSRVRVDRNLIGGTGVGTGVSSIAWRFYRDGPDPLLVALLSSGEEPAGRLLATDGAGGLQWVASPVTLQLADLTSDLHLYVATSGDDANAGTSPAAPFATLERAIARLETIRSILDGVRCVVHVASGTYAWTTTLGGIRLHPRAVLAIVGDGAGQEGDDGCTELVPPTAAGSGSSAAVVATTGLTEHALRGKTIEILTGSAAGDRRTVAENGTTTITPCAPFTAAVASGDQWRVVEPAVVFTLPTTPHLIAQDLGTVDAWSTVTGASLPLLSQLTIAGVRLSYSAAKIFSGCRTALYGVELAVSATNVINVHSSALSWGCDYRNGDSPVGLALGAPHIRSWMGWGVSNVGAAGALALFECESAYGFFVGVTLGSLSIDEGRMHLLGGSIRSADASNAALYAVRRPTQLLVGVSAPATALRIEHTGAQPAVALGRGSVAGGPVHARLERCTLVSATGPALRARGIAHVHLNGDTGGAAANRASGTGAVGLDASWGAQVTVSGVLALTGSTGDVTVDAGSSYGAAGDLSAAGSVRFNSVDGSRVQRIF